jgi:hypothetical protein
MKDKDCSSTNKIFWFFGNVFIYTDMFIPVPLELGRQKNKVYSIFLNEKGYELVKDNITYFNWLNRFTIIKRISTVPRKSPFYKLFRIINLFSLSLEMLFSSKYLAFFPYTSGANLSTCLLSLIAYVRGVSIAFGGIYVINIMDTDADHIPKKEFLGKLQKGNRKPRRVNKYIKYNKVLFCNKDQIYIYKRYKGLKVLSQSNHLILSHPKLQNWWKDFVDKYPPSYDREEISINHNIISVFITFQGCFFYDKDSDLDVLLKEILSSIRLFFPKTLIAIKPKAQINFVWLNEFIHKLNDDNIVITNTPVSVLSKKSIFGVTACLSNALFEFVINGKPWIEYGRYSQFWKSYYPPLTFTEEFGGIFTQSIGDLQKCISSIKEKNFDLKRLKKQIDFKDVNIDFDFFFK